jgi:putative peptide zinc metalloprotease protein
MTQPISPQNASEADTTTLSSPEPTVASVPEARAPVPAPAPAATTVPHRAEGVSLLGEYEGGGYDEPRYLVSRGDGQMVLVSRMLYAVAEAVGDDRTLGEVAELAGRAYGANLSPQAVHYLIEQKLQPLGLVTLGPSVAAAPRADPLLALALHRVLLPAKAVRRLAAFFAPLFVPVVVIVVALALVALDVWLLATGHANTAIHQSIGSPALMLAVLGVLLANTLFHECGHAAGCHYGGGRPGAIGVGVLIVIPAFYTNVTDAYRLNRRGRLRTDLGGIYFNAVFVIVLGAIYLPTGFAAIPVVIVLIHLQMLQQLMPLVRMDGYYILGDLVGVPNLFEQIRPILRHTIFRREPERSVTNLRRGTRVTVSVWVGIVVPVLVAAMVNVLIFLPSFFQTAMINVAHYWTLGSVGYHEGDAGLVAVALVSVLILLVPWLGIGSLLTRAVLKTVRLITRRRNARAPRHRRGGQAGRQQGDLVETDVPGAE